MWIWVFGNCGLSRREVLVSRALVMVYFWSSTTCIFTVLYAVTSLSSGKPPAPMPAAMGYLSVGLLGVFVGNVLTFQERRISQLERMLSNRS